MPCPGPRLFSAAGPPAGQSFGRVLYYSPWEKAYPVLNEGIIGAGFGEIIRCNDFWRVKKSIDLFVFPDIYHAGLQAELRSQGCRVWGAGDGMKLELDREFFLKKLKELGLAVPPFKTFRGLSALTEYLRDKKDKFIKVSMWRGSWETKHWKSWEEMRAQIGPVGRPAGRAQRTRSVFGL